MMRDEDRRRGGEGRWGVYCHREFDRGATARGLDRDAVCMCTCY